MYYTRKQKEISLDLENQIEQSLSNVAENVRGSVLILIKNGQVIVEPEDKIMEAE